MRIPLNLVAEHLLDADILSYRTAGFWRDPIGKGIAVAGRGEECHTGMFCRDNGHLVALGMRLAAQKLKLLEDEVADNHGRIDVYRYTGYTRWTGRLPYQCQGLDRSTRQQVVSEVRRFALHDEYGWLNVLVSSSYFIPGLRWLVAPHFPDVDAMKLAPFCSQAVSFAFRKMGLPLLRNRADRQILPGDVVTSPLLLYVCTLDPPADTGRRIDSFYAEAYGLRVAGDGRASK